MVALESDVVIDVIVIHITARFVSVYYRQCITDISDIFFRNAILWGYSCLLLVLKY